jgi:LPS export ABC transporter protein LptC
LYANQETRGILKLTNVDIRLERLLTHRIIRVLQGVLPILVVALIAVPAWNYYGRREVKDSSPKSGAKLPSGVSVRTEGFTYSRTEGGRTQFTVHAKQSLAFKDDNYILRDVDITIYGATDKDPPRIIRGNNCTYDQASNDVTCDGNVEVQLDEKTVIRTENVIYKHRDGIIIAPQRATIEKTGTTAHANSFEYGMSSGLLKLNGDVKVQTPDHVELETGSALFHQKENWTTMSGGVFIKSLNGWIRGLTGRASLEPDTYKLRKITIDGNVTAESMSQAAQERWKLRSDWIEATISETGTAERIQTRGKVEIEKIAGNTSQRLGGDEIDTQLKEGKVDVLEARQNARMTFGPDQTLEASQIWTNATGSVRTTDNSVLKVGDSTIRGREFVIDNGVDIVTFNTLRRATLEKEGGLKSSSDQTRARFGSKTSTLLELVQTGNFQFRTPQYEGRAQSGRFEEGGTVVTLEGSPVVTDSEKRLEASSIRVNQKDNSFVATKNVSTLMKNAREPVLVKADRAESGVDSLLYTGNVQLWRGDAFIRAERLTATGKESQDGTVHAEGGPKSKVQSNLQNMRATSDTLDYDEARGVARYLGHVRAQKQDMILETSDMTAHFRDNMVTEIVASGGVEVMRADQHGTGERAVYDARTDVVTLTGKNVQVRDKEHGLVQGASLTIKNKGQAASVEGGNGERTITRHPLKNDK